MPFLLGAMGTGDGLREALEMPNDAKLGLIVGVAVVIAISVAFFRKEPVRSGPRGTEPAAAAVSANSMPTSGAHSLSNAVKGEMPEAAER